MERSNKIMLTISHLQVHLIDGRGASSSLDSARQNLAATFVNAFVNAGFGQVSFLRSLCGLCEKMCILRPLLCAG
jgi:hypothetical protein